MSDWPHIPSYSDSENTVFHPVFSYALEIVIKQRKLDDVEVLPQFPTASGPVDFVLRRKSTGKIILPIEIKRTKSGVRGLGRRQARDYQHNIASFSETSFYCVSNLELTELFKADNHRQTTISQKIELLSIQDALLENSQDEKVKQNLVSVIDEIFDIIFFEKSFIYSTGMQNLEYSLRNTINGSHYWHESILPFCYEYIRGTPRLLERTRQWKPASSYKLSPQRLIDLGERIDFKNIFSPPVSHEEHFDIPILEDAYNSGRFFGDGDDFSALVGDILFDPQNGVVETDFDLARLLAIAAKNETNDWQDGCAILDPCAGSGRLLAAAVQDCYPTISPTSVIAVEQESRFAEALTLRLGLQFGRCLSPKNSPTIRICSFESVDPKDLSKVKIALVNPPFMSGVKSVDEKKEILNRIHSISGKPSIVGIGQIGYEAVFMELLWHVLPDKCTIAFIFPYQVISRLSKEMAELRLFLAKQLSISTIILYPRSGVFESVVKKTAIFIGHKGVSSSDVRIVDIQIPVPDVDFTKFREHLEDSRIPCYGVTDFVAPRSALLSAIDSGWQRIMGAGARVSVLLNRVLAPNNSFKIHPSCIRRGTMGNCGNTALTVMSRNDIHPYIPRKWIIGAVNNAKKLPPIIFGGNAPNLSFILPEEAKNENSIHYESLNETVSSYIEEANGEFSTKKQKTAMKSFSQIQGDLIKDQRNPASNSILIPRACREEAKLSIVENAPILVSTNFLIIPVEDKTHRYLMASWLKSIFGQLQLELFATSQEGMRKLEKNAIIQVRFPKLQLVKEDTISKLIECFVNEPFLDLSEVKIRESDCIWGNILKPSGGNLLVEHVKSLLLEEYDNRVQ